MLTNPSQFERKPILPAWLRAAMAWVVEWEHRIFFFPEYLLTLGYILPVYLVTPKRETRTFLLEVCWLRYHCVWMKTLAATFAAGRTEPNNLSRLRDRLRYRIERLDGFLESLY
jgi:hypothetical protein